MDVADHMDSEGRRAVSQAGLDQKPTVLKVVGAQLICQRKDTNPEKLQPVSIMASVLLPERRTKRTPRLLSRSRM